MSKTTLVMDFGDVDNRSVPEVGGKNASLGELIRAFAGSDVRVPPGFATTAAAYRRFLDENDLVNALQEHLDAYRCGDVTLATAGAAIRKAIEAGRLPDAMAAAIRDAYARLGDDVAVAVRSSATAEDLPEASFAGQQESYLNVVGADAVLEACRRCMASLFTDRAIAYRDAHGFDHLDVALSVGVQRMVRSDLGAAGVLFTIDTETGFPGTIVITSSWGLGETVVKGITTPDQFVVFKPALDGSARRPIVGRSKGAKGRKLVHGTSTPTQLVTTSADERAGWSLADDDVLALARAGLAIERHYRRAMDVEWAKDGETGELFVVQARPETVQARKAAATLKSYRLDKHGERIVTGLAIGDAIASGTACRIDTPAEGERFDEHAVLVTANTDPDWVPIMKRAAAVVTDHGGRTSHAAIVSRELGLPAIVGCGDATRLIEDGARITVSCAEGDAGHVYRGDADFEVIDVDLEGLPQTRTEVMLNLANPAAALRWWRLPADGVGLARMEFVISNWIRIHPMALARPDAVEDEAARRRIAKITADYADGAAFLVEKLAEGIAELAMAFHPKPMILRTSDFKTNEYANLIGGRAFEPVEANPMLGFRGASRYASERYRAGFLLECAAIRRAREVLGLDNILVMIPFCRTLKEADEVLAVMAEGGLERGKHGLEVYVMCEIPSNVILADSFAERFDGFSIGSNDLTQLTLGVDRDSDLLADVFDENDAAVRWMIETVAERAHAKGRKVGFCGQRPSNDPGFARFLVAAGLDSVSVTPDSFVAVKREIARAERQ